MLSIGKLVAGQARYYLDPVEGRVDAIESVGEGAEEYYLGGSEARGTWAGTGSARLELDGPVEASALRSVLAGLAHVAQGATVDRAYMLAGKGLSPEWAYTAMSRGRHHNALYLAEADRARDEFAPRETHLRATRDHLITGLERTEVSSLAIDSGRVCEVRPEQVIGQARRALDAARARRATHELDRAEGREQ